MNYLVVVSYDVKNGESADHEFIHEELKQIGLEDRLTDSTGRENGLPATTVAGTFEGSSARNVRNNICTKVGSAFRKHNLHGKIFISVGGSWDWGVRNTR